jgi:hypothetical protein
VTKAGVCDEVCGKDPDRTANTAKTASEANFLIDCFIPKTANKFSGLDGG